MTVRALFSMGVNVLGGIYIYIDYVTRIGSSRHIRVATQYSDSEEVQWIHVPFESNNFSVTRERYSVMVFTATHKHTAALTVRREDVY